MIEKIELRFNDFVGIEQQRLFSSLFNLGKLSWLIPELESVYDGLDVSYINSETKVIIFYSRFNFYNALACFLRSHYSSAYASIRVALDLCFHHYNIANNSYSVNEFFAESALHQRAKIKAKNIQKLDNNTTVTNILNRLFERHDFASSFGSHADPRSFAYRAIKNETTGTWAFSFLQTRNVNETRIEFIKMLNIFVDITQFHLLLNESPEASVGVALHKIQINNIRSQLTKLAIEVEKNAATTTKGGDGGN